MDFKETAVNVSIKGVEELIQWIASGEAWDTISALVNKVEVSTMTNEEKFRFVYDETKPLFFIGFKWFLKAVIEVAVAVMRDEVAAHNKTQVQKIQGA